MSSANSKSSCCSPKFQWIPLRASLIVSFIVQSIASKNKNSAIKQPCLTPVFLVFTQVINSHVSSPKQRKGFCIKIEFNSRRINWNSNMAVVSLFRGSNMATVTSGENQRLTVKLTMKDFANHPIVGVFDYLNEFPWYAIVSHKEPQNTFIQAIKSLLEVNKIDVERSIPFK